MYWFIETMFEAEIIEVSVTQMGIALILKNPSRERVVPIFIGPLETYSISTALEDQKSERPLTHDLMKSTLVSMGYNIQKVIVDDFHSGTFYAKIVIVGKDRSNNSFSTEIDARPSDAIALAIRFCAPIFMVEKVYKQTSIDVDILKEKLGHTRSEERDIADESDSSGSDFMLNEHKRDLLQSILEEFGRPVEENTPVHKKNVPKAKKKEEIFKSKRDVLNQMLKVAVLKEQYEYAAKIRDELSALQYSSPQKKRYRKGKDLPQKK